MSTATEEAVRGWTNEMLARQLRELTEAVVGILEVEEAVLNEAATRLVSTAGMAIKRPDPFPGDDEEPAYAKLVPVYIATGGIDD